MRKLLTVLLVTAAPVGMALAADRAAPPAPMPVLSAPVCATAAPLILGSARQLPREAGARRPAAPPAAPEAVPEEEEEEATLRPAFQLCVPPEGAVRPVYRT